ncbi:MAG: DsbA family protein [Thermoanaerobaculia bacterium]
MRPSVLICAAVFTVSTSFAQTTDQDIRKEIRELKEGQAAIQKDLQEIKRLLLTLSAPAPDALPKDPINIRNDPKRGEHTARVAIIEYSDFQCPYCGRYDRETFPQIEAEYIKTGKVQYVWRDLPLSFHKNAAKAAEAARCAGEQGKFWDMRDRLFHNQAALEATDLAAHAIALKLVSKQFQECLDGGRYGPAIQKAIAEANSVGLTGTPSFLIGIVQPDSTVKVAGKIIGAKAYAEFKALIDSLLAAPGAQAQ